MSQRKRAKEADIAFSSEETLKANEEERRIKQENNILQEMLRLDREIRKPPVPPSRRQPKVGRLQSKRMRNIQGQTNNPIRAMFQTPEQALRGHEADEVVEENTTRNVGPRDNGSNYCHGKETGTKSGD